MIIESISHDSYITIEHIGDSNYHSFCIEAELGKDHHLEYFKGFNRDVQLLNLDKFIKDLNSFITDRKMKPRLEGTYDFCIEIQAIGATRAFLIIYLGYDKVITEFKTFRYCVSGCFEIDLEYMNQMVQNFKELKIFKNG